MFRHAFFRFMLDACTSKDLYHKCLELQKEVSNNYIKMHFYQYGWVLKPPIVKTKSDLFIELHFVRCPIKILLR